LLFGLIAAVTGATGFTLPAASRDWLIAAVLLFVVATALGIATANIPVPYGQAAFDGAALAQAWTHPASAARENVARAQLDLIPVAEEKRPEGAADRRRRLGRAARAGRAGRRRDHHPRVEAWKRLGRSRMMVR
jgi:hypothetical protein